MAKRIVTGIDQRGTSLEWTQLRPIKSGQFDQVESPPARAGAGEFDFVESLKEQVDSLKGDLHYAMNSDQVLLRVVDLPTTDADEIKEMVELQIDKYSPFPSEHMNISHELLHQSENESRVLIAGAQKSVVGPLGEAFTEAGLRLARIDVDVLAWWSLIREDGSLPPKGRQAVLILDHTGTELILVDDRIPFYFASFGLPEEESYEEFLGGVAEELQYTLASIEGEWGETENATIHVWHWGNVPPGLDRLQRSTGFNVSTHELSTVPRVSRGVAQRGLHSEALIDLVPQEWKTAESSRMFKQTLVRSTGIMLGLWLLLMGTVFGLFKFEAKRYSELKEKDRLTKIEVDNLDKMESRIESLKQFKDRRYSVLECIREAVILMPNQVELITMTYRKSDKVDIRGKAPTAALALEYNGNLENSALFAKIESHYVKNSRGATEFKYTAHLP